MRLAGHHHRPAHVAVELGQGPAAIDQPVAALDHDVRVGADHGQVPLQAMGEALPIVLWRLDLVVEGAGAADERSVFGSGEGQVQAFIERSVAVGPDGPGGARGALRQQRPRRIAGGHEGRPGRAGHAQKVQLSMHGLRWPRGVGDQHHRALLGGEALKGVTGGGEALSAVVDHAPDVAQQDVVVGGDGGEAGQGKRRAHAPAVTVCGRRVNGSRSSLRSSPRRRGTRFIHELSLGFTWIPAFAGMSGFTLPPASSSHA